MDTLQKPCISQSKLKDPSREDVLMQMQAELKFYMSIGKPYKRCFVWISLTTVCDVKAKAKQGYHGMRSM